jgi:hypothetical protein
MVCWSFTFRQLTDKVNAGANTAKLSESEFTEF